MKTWINAELAEVTISETQYGGKTVTSFDNVYQNEKGNWEATMNS